MNVIEWTINNFSHWNEYVHEKQIESSGTSFSKCPRIILYPRGLSGCEERIVVHVYGKDHVSTSGHLSCIGSNGSLICRQEISEKEKKGNFYELKPNLKFTDVADLIKKNENRHQDRFTLRCTLKWVDERAYHLYTTIDVFDSTVKLDLSTLKEMKNDLISTIQYSLDDVKTKFLAVLKVDTIFSLQPIDFQKNIYASTYLSVLNSDSVTRTEEEDHVFQNDTSWPFLNSLTKKEVSEKGFSLILRIKISPGNRYRHNGYFKGYPKLFDLLPTHTIFTHYASSVPEDISTKSLNTATSNKPDNSVTVLLSELMCLYQDHDFSDFQLRCGEVSVPTHKSILSARSPVFKAMLLSDMKEAASDSMDIADLDVHTLGRFLVFLYTGSVDDLQWEGALKLYYAADKYQVPTLKRECFSVFHKNVSVSNVCDILSLADKHLDEELTAEAHSFILKNYNDVLRSEGWRMFVKNEPVLAVNTVTYFAEKNEFKVKTNS